MLGKSQVSGTKKSSMKKSSMKKGSVKITSMKKTSHGLSFGLLVNDAMAGYWAVGRSEMAYT